MLDLAVTPRSIPTLPLPAWLSYRQEANNYTFITDARFLSSTMMFCSVSTQSTVSRPLLSLSALNEPVRSLSPSSMVSLRLALPLTNMRFKSKDVS